MSPKVVYLLYFSILLANWGNHLDLGIFANSAKEIANRFNITNTEVGVLSTGFVYGNIGGTILSAPLYSKF